MKKKFLFLVISVAHSILGSSKTDMRASHADTTGDFHITEFVQNGQQFKVTSYFDLKPHASTLQSTFNGSGTYDLRGLEKIYCKSSQASMSCIKRFRGSLGFLLGAAVSLPIALLGKKNNK